MERATYEQTLDNLLAKALRIRRDEQGAEYIVQQLKLYASGERHNDVYARMRTIASQLTPSEIDGLAGYYRAGFR